MEKQTDERKQSGTSATCGSKSAVERLVMRYVVARNDGKLELMSHHETFEEAQNSAHDGAIVCKAKILFAANGNVRRWDMSA
jgi:hypothetical protein